MGKTYKEIDPYEHVRRDTPPPGKVIKSKKQYNRKKKKWDIIREIEEFHDEIDRNIQIL